jgi:glycosyltransferase involved in cell wall biosynthesis
MKIAYFSPFNPLKSGISDFSEELILQLKNYIDIDLFVDNYKLSNKEIKDNFEIYNINDFYKKNIRNKYNQCVFQVGNNERYHGNIIDAFTKFSGILELHDFSIHHYIAEHTYAKNDINGYIDYIQYSHGEGGVKIVQKFLQGKAPAPWDAKGLEITVNKHLIDRATAIIVHSDMAKQMARAINPNKPIINIPLHTVDIYDDYISFKNKCKQALSVKDNCLVFGSFGFATRAKRIIQTLSALAMYKKINKNFVYYIVGKVENLNLKEYIQKLNLIDNVIITEFVTLEKLKQYMGACDICFNLRYPTHGESSSSLHRLIGMGKPIIVTDIGTFQEYPDDIVLKVRYDDNEIEDIFKAICKLADNKKELCRRSEASIELAKQKFDIQRNAKQYAKFFEDISNNTFVDNYVDLFIDKLMELKLDKKQYIQHITNDAVLNDMLLM